MSRSTVYSRRRSHRIERPRAIVARRRAQTCGARRGECVFIDFLKEFPLPARGAPSGAAYLFCLDRRLILSSPVSIWVFCGSSFLVYCRHSLANSLMLTVPYRRISTVVCDYSSSQRRHAAVHEQQGAGDVGGIVGGQERLRRRPPRPCPGASAWCLVPPGRCIARLSRRPPRCGAHGTA